MSMITAPLIIPSSATFKASVLILSPMLKTSIKGSCTDEFNVIVMPLPSLPSLPIYRRLGGDVDLFFSFQFLRLERGTYD